jgi:AraC family transcriptional regulator of adaptative response / DNA-3-methyladenine glycosylase II
MATVAANLPLDPRACERVRRTRDARFDGLLYIAVKSTGIFCRPVCPAPSPKSRNVVYYGTAAAAAAAGFRPCLRCRPELAPGAPAWRASDELVRGALRLIEQGALDTQPVAALAARVGVGERHLRRLFAEQLGASPVDVAAMRRVLFAKRLISDTALPMTTVAEAAGYSSLRRFNAAFQGAYRMAPRDVRRRRIAPTGVEGHEMRLPYRRPFAVRALFEFFAKRAMPGIEVASAGGYRRSFVLFDEPGVLSVRALDDDDALLLRVIHPRPQALLEVATRVRRMFDLDADAATIQSQLSRDARLKPLLRQHPGLRVPGTWDPFELSIRAVLGQQVTVAAARTLASRIVARHGRAIAAPHDAALDRLFPTPDVLADADLHGIGLTGARIATIHTVARAWRDGVVDCRPEQTLEEFVARWTALPGIGAWTAHYLGMRALGHPDAFPAGDIVLRKALEPGRTLSEKELDAASQAWRPWRAYAVLWLWRSMG